MSVCEYNPNKKEASYYLEGHNGKTNGCQNEATICVGYNGKWHLCDTCAKLPEFKKYKKRHNLKKVNNETNME